ncbi:alpha-ketoacid dehydrogenase subunit alpha/beta [Cytophaga aurantiaca]|uniref:alpha-ketoacid dehydrogenase subunit alpha/beta n=1 Tax=Cytophaga aurantiaca TaxID=29530 RepID=UPI0003A46017|nr:dehydrogenase E1 component subunit alpha/beta [Cytophaga aurantiaca]
MISFERNNIDQDTLVRLYKELLKPRMIEEKMLFLLRQGKISKWFSGIGQEAISVGVACALEKEEYILPLHRNLGIFTSRGVPLHRLFCQFQGKPSGFTKGRDRSFHFGSKEHHIVGMISHLGPQMAVADGIALAEKLSRSNRATLVFTGDGGTSEGDFHEALNLASVWDLPVIFLVENNGYGLSTPLEEQFRIKSFKEKGPAYAIETHTIDGNNILEVYTKIRELAEYVRRESRPVLVEAITFRMRGHEEASGTKYIPEQLFEAWAKKDPVENFERYLLDEAILSLQEIESIKEKIKYSIEEAWAYTENEKEVVADSTLEEEDMYAPYVHLKIRPRTTLQSNKRFIDAISDGLRLAMEKFPRLIQMGQDIAEYGGVFKVTEGLIERFSKQRVRNTPLCESSIIGAGLGLAIKDYKSVIEMQFADFITNGFNQVVNNLAKSHYRWEQPADVVIRMPTGAGTSGGPFHSQSTEAWFFHTPGLKIVYPSNPYDAKGLLLAAIEDPNPVLYFEHKALYRSISAEIPDDYYTVPIGEAVIVEEGDDITIVAYGNAVWWAKEAVKKEAASADIIDLRSLLPWDKETVLKSVLKTGRVLVINEDTITGSISAEIAAWISENAFENLDAPVMRVGSLDTAVPFSKTLEDNFLPVKRIQEKLKELQYY